MKPISVSSVVACHVCPRRLYFDLGQERQQRESPRYTVCKQISYHLGHELHRERIWREILAVMPAADGEVRAFFDACMEACEAARWTAAVETDVPVASERLGIHGVVDKIFDGEPAFAITRSTDPPKAGVYNADRLRIACYAACVQEALGREVEVGWVEYVPGGICRPCTPQPRDRRAALKAIGAAKKVLAGSVPNRPLKAPCESCPHSERCLTGIRPLSDLL
ncbi:MAG: Dna2/Cas4 domain-containing protein [Methanomicrobiaceae archaeon]|uniref:Dna2/Cas4 domain-containing protein n=1 Tax=hydrocarbon metagenome TaxID=938273 RepID=A0A0W8FHF8_9ZZZZ|nr:Dna2/Cas4 domain-containing protein [Methanomicrobiaceae archaeon]MDD5419732.1 Dna2/Cas4 domain-containing protein [Methanomicrobiaceae archaeon]